MQAWSTSVSRARPRDCEAVLCHVAFARPIALCKLMLDRRCSSGDNYAVRVTLLILLISQM